MEPESTPPTFSLHADPPPPRLPHRFLPLPVGGLRIHTLDTHGCRGHSFGKWAITGMVTASSIAASVALPSMAL